MNHKTMENIIFLINAFSVPSIMLNDLLMYSTVFNPHGNNFVSSVVSHTTRLRLRELKCFSQTDSVKW